MKRNLLILLAITASSLAWAQPMRTLVNPPTNWVHVVELMGTGTGTAGLGVTMSTGTPVAFGTLSQTVAAADTPERLSATATPFRHVTFTGYKAARTANTGTVWIQWAAADGSPGIPLETGMIVSLVAPLNRYYSADMFWIDVENAGDGVQAIFEP